MNIMVLARKKYIYLVITFLLSVSLFSCSENDDVQEDLYYMHSMIRGCWFDEFHHYVMKIEPYYGNDNSDIESSCSMYYVGGSKPESCISSGSFTYSISFYVPFNSWSDDVVVDYVDSDVLELKGKDNYYFKRISETEYNKLTSSSNTGGGGNNTGGGTGGGGNNSGSEQIPYESYIKYKYGSSTYVHEISFVKSEVELAPSGTIHGWNYKYLNVYIANRYVVFQLESTYREDEIPTSGRWPAGTYEIDSYSGNSITHWPIAQVNVIDTNYNSKNWYTVKGVAKISYSGNTMILEFKDSESDPDKDIELYFKGTI